MIKKIAQCDFCQDNQQLSCRSNLSDMCVCEFKRAVPLYMFFFTCMQIIQRKIENCVLYYNYKIETKVLFKGMFSKFLFVIAISTFIS